MFPYRVEWEDITCLDLGPRLAKEGALTSLRHSLGRVGCRLEQLDTPPYDGMVTSSRQQSTPELKDLGERPEDFELDAPKEGIVMSSRHSLVILALTARADRRDRLLAIEGSVMSSRHSLGMDSCRCDIPEEWANEGMVSSSRQDIGLELAPRDEYEGIVISSRHSGGMETSWHVGMDSSSRLSDLCPLEKFRRRAASQPRPVGVHSSGIELETVVTSIWLVTRPQGS